MKKNKTKSRVSNNNMIPDLPQNIISVGERVFDDKNIYINQKIYTQIHKFALNKTENEHGGILIGTVINEMGKENTIIDGFIEAKYDTATPTTLTFTHETWEYFHSEIDKKYKDKKIVGWIHTHPNFGIFLSENDRFIQQNFFTDINQVAYVIDPIQKEEGFFFWINGKLERCPGFYLYDKNGVKINPKILEKENTENKTYKQSSAGYLLSVVLFILLVVNMFVTLNQSAKIKRMETEIYNIKKYIEFQQIFKQQIIERFEQNKLNEHPNETEQNELNDKSDEDKKENNNDKQQNM